MDYNLNPMTIRLQKYLAESGVASRRAAEELIAEGVVTVNGERILSPGVKVDPQKDKVKVKGKLVHPQPKGMILFNKPKGVITSRRDPENRKSVYDYLPKKYHSYFTIGRLDYNTSGLLVLTNDGDLAERLSHPRYGLERVYKVRVSGKIKPKTIEKLKRGVKLEDGVVQVAKLTIVSSDEDSTWLELTLKEGRNRIVRRLFEKLYHPVIKLQRVRFGPFALDALKVGEMEPVSDSDYQKLRRKHINKP